MKVVEVDKPEDGVIVKILGSGICGTDLKTYLNGHHFFKPPTILGHEFYGVVQKVPEGISNLKIGDFVVAAPYYECNNCEKCRRGTGELCDNKDFLPSGSFCEYISIPANYIEKGVFKLESPDDVYTLVEPLACVINGINKLDIKSNNRVLIVGAGPMGALFALVFLNKGIQVTAAETSEKRRRMVETWGINTVSPGDVKKDEYDQIVIAVNKGGLVSHYASLVSDGGNVLLFSGLPRNETISIDPYDIHYREVKIAGSFGYPISQFKGALEIIKSGPELFRKVITHTMPLTDGVKAFELLQTGDAMKVVLKP